MKNVLYPSCDINPLCSCEGERLSLSLPPKFSCKSSVSPFFLLMCLADEEDTPFFMNENQLRMTVQLDRQQDKSLSCARLICRPSSQAQHLKRKDSAGAILKDGAAKSTDFSNALKSQENEKILIGPGENYVTPCMKEFRSTGQILCSLRCKHTLLTRNGSFCGRPILRVSTQHPSGSSEPSESCHNSDGRLQVFPFSILFVQGGQAASCG